MSDVVMATHEREEQATGFVLCRALFVTFSRDEKVSEVKLQKEYM
jgi:hypothetical protein